MAAGSPVRPTWPISIWFASPPRRPRKTWFRLFGQHEHVRYAELNSCYYVQATFVPDDKLYSYQWNLENPVTGDIRMNEAWGIEQGDPNVIVAVVDSGVAYETYGAYQQAPDLAQHPVCAGV